MFDSYFLNAVAEALNPFNIMGKIRAYTSPVLDFIDWQLGYEDFQFCYDGKPDEDKIEANKVYFFKQDNKLYCCNKELDIDLELFPEDIGEKVHEEMMTILDDKEKEAILSTESQTKLYDFLVLNKVNVGIKQSFHKKFVQGTKDMEDNFIAKHPGVYNGYLIASKGFKNICIFASSQTGMRIASIASSVAVAIASGGIVPLALAGAYVGGIGIAVVQQTASRVGINKLSEEAELLERYKKNNTLLGKNPVFLKDSRLNEAQIQSPAMKWIKSVSKHISTYFFEAALPVLLSMACPTNGIVNILKIGSLAALSAVGVGVGSYFRKFHEDEKELLKEAIAKAKESPDVPNYKDLAQLKEIIKRQEIEMGKADVNNDPSLQNKSRFKEFFYAMGEVLNPYSDYQKVKDHKIFAKTITGLSASMIATTALATESPEVAIAGLVTATIVSAGSIATNYYVYHTKLKGDGYTAKKYSQEKHPRAFAQVESKDHNYEKAKMQAKHLVNSSHNKRVKKASFVEKLQKEHNLKSQWRNQ
ncbi:MAG: hypothetical protein AABY27_04270 [Pseudomonadota bacterium]